MGLTNWGDLLGPEKLAIWNSPDGRNLVSSAIMVGMLFLIDNVIPGWAFVDIPRVDSSRTIVRSLEFLIFRTKNNRLTYIKFGTYTRATPKPQYLY